MLYRAIEDATSAKTGGVGTIRSAQFGGAEPTDQPGSVTNIRNRLIQLDIPPQESGMWQFSSAAGSAGGEKRTETRYFLLLFFGYGIDD